MRTWGVAVLAFAACHPRQRPAQVAQVANHRETTVHPRITALEQKIAVRGMVFAADGAHLLTGGFDGIIWPSSPNRGAWEWDLATGARTKTIAGAKFQSLAVSRDLVAFVYDQRQVHVQNFVSGQQLFVRSTTGSQANIAISPDATRIASIGEDELVHVWKLDGTEQSFDSKHSFLFAVAFLHDNEHLIIGSGSGNARIYSLDGSERARLVGAAEGNPDEVWSVAVSPDGRWVATGGGDGTLRVWDADALGEVHTPALALTGSHETLYSVAFSGDGRVIAAGSGDGTARAWTFPAATPLGTFAGGTHEDKDGKSISAVALSADGTTLAVGDSGGSIRLYTLAL